MGLIKKCILTTAAVAGGLWVVNNATGHRGILNTIWKRTAAQMETKIPPELELARIKDQIAQLTPDMHHNISKIAEEMVEVKTLEVRVGDLKDRLVASKSELKLFSDAIENKTVLVSTSGREVRPTATMVKDRLRTCKNVERELTTSQKILDAKANGLDSARQQLAEMKRQKDELMTLAADFEAELKTLQLEQTRAKIKLDDSRLGEIKQSFESLRARIEVERKKAELASQWSNDALTTPDKKVENREETLDEVRDYLKEKTDSAKK